MIDSNTREEKEKKKKSFSEGDTSKQETSQLTKSMKDSSHVKNKGENVPGRKDSKGQQAGKNVALGKNIILSIVLKAV